MGRRVAAPSAQLALGEQPKAKVKAEPRWCPVGWCDPTRATPYKPRDGRDFCDRHGGKLSEPMRRQLDVSRRIGGEVFARGLGEAIAEARRNDPAWHAWAIVWRVNYIDGGERVRQHVEGQGRRGRTQGWPFALRRVWALYRAGIRVHVRDIERGIERTDAQFLWASRFEVFEGGERLSTGATLSAALLAMPWRSDPDLAGLEVINTKLGRSLTYAEALALEEEGQHA